MIPISEKEEDSLDKGFLYTEKGDFDFTIEPKDVICYGPIDFHNASDDFHVIEDMKFLDHLTMLGVSVPANYDYNNHCCYSPDKKAKWYDSTNPAIVAQYFHGRLNKPERCCIFKERICNGRTQRVFSST